MITAGHEVESAEHEIELLLDREVRPAFSAHGGGIDLITIEGNEVTLNLRGSCESCYFRRSCVANLVRPTLAEEFGDRFEYRVS